MKKFFITSSGTNIGKTLVTAALAHQATHTGIPLCVTKPVVSGFDMQEEGDIHLLLRAMGKNLTEEHLADMCCFRYQAPLSPDMAARKEGNAVVMDTLLDFCTKKHKVHPNALHLVEGIGGVMVPLNEKKTVLDWMTALNWPVILVVGSYLGSLSHTLTAFYALQQKHANIHAVIITATPHPEALPLEETRQSLSSFISAPLYLLPTVKNTPSFAHAPSMLDWLK